MKKLMKNIKVPVVAMLAFLLAILPVMGASVTYGPTVASTNNVVATSGNITSLVLSGTTNTVLVKLFDASTNTLTYVIGAYTNYTVNVYTNTQTWTDILGASVTNSYKFWTNVPSTVAQSTNNFRILGTFSVPSGETVTINYDAAHPFWRGVTVTNSGQVNITVNYLPWR